MGDSEGLSRGREGDPPYLHSTARLVVVAPPANHGHYL